MSGFSWSEFFVLFGAGLFSVIVVLPYAFTINKDRLSQVKVSLPVLVILSAVQSGVTFAIVTAIGLLAAKSVGLGAPLLERALAGEPALPALLERLPVAVGLGLVAVTLLIALENLVFLPRVPEALRLLTPGIPFWKRVMACFYGGIGEEILMRLFLVSLFAWLGSQIWQTPAGLPTEGVFWGSIFLAAFLFGVGHLPATAAITRLTPLVVTRGLALNGICGIAFGYLYWQHGLEAAMLAHFSADVVLHLIAPLFAKPEDHKPLAVAVQS